MSFVNNIKDIMGNKDEPAKPAAASVTSSSKKVLIVEDEDMLASALELKLKHEGLEVVKAANGQLGLEMALSFKPDIILMDLLMPVMDGKTMLHELRKLPEYKNIPVIVLTNAGNVDNMKETQVYENANEFLVKSNVSLEEVVSKVKSLI